MHVNVTELRELTQRVLAERQAEAKAEEVAKRAMDEARLGAILKQIGPLAREEASKGFSQAVIMDLYEDDWILSTQDSTQVSNLAPVAAKVFAYCKMQGLNPTIIWGITNDENMRYHILIHWHE